jgi:hypothetical protein
MPLRHDHRPVDPLTDRRAEIRVILALRVVLQTTRTWTAHSKFLSKLKNVTYVPLCELSRR